MAHANTFIVDFRTAITKMIESFNEAAELAQKCADLGWDAATFTPMLENQDISAEEFYGAVTAVLGMREQAAGMYAGLTKLMT